MTRVLAVAAALVLIVGCAATNKDFDWSANAPAKDDKILIFVGGNTMFTGGLWLPKTATLRTLEEMVTVRPEWRSRRVTITGADIKEKKVYRVNTMTDEEKEAIKLRHGDKIFFVYDRCFGLFVPNQRPGVDAGVTRLVMFKPLRAGTTQAGS